MRRRSTLITAVAVAALALAPSFADARAGGGSSSGSRGSRTYSAPPSTSTAPGMAAPMERSMAPRPAPGGVAGGPVGQAPQRSGFGSGLMGGLAGGLLGVGLGGLLMGNGFFGGGMGILGLLGFLLQIAVVFFVARFLFRLLFRRQGGPAMAGPMGAGSMGAGSMGAGAAPGSAAGGPMARLASGGALGGGAMGAGAMGAGAMGAGQAPVQVGPGDFESFERLLKDVQAAWSTRDLRALSTISTPEMASIFADQLAEQTSRGVHNVVSDVTLEQGDLSEAWSEGGREYATVAMRFSMTDVTRDQSGRIVDGDLALRTMATEVWTFVRAPGGRWLLSAIQQTR